MNIDIKVIRHCDQRYETPGDYWFEPDETLHIRVSKLGDWRYETLIAFHELFEASYCKFFKIKVEDIDAFDKKFEKERAEGKHDTQAEGGDDPRAPYRFGHFWATTAERMLGACLMVDWNRYDEAVVALLPKSLSGV